MSKTFYITTPIYYTSGNLHIGHAYTTVVCDAIARYKKLRGYDVFYLTGTDEHGEKVQMKAEEANLTPQEFVDGIVDKIKDLWKTLNVDYDRFIRTTDKDHYDSVQKIFSKFLEQGDIYKDKYEGWYCTPCESFWTESQLDENHCCPDCNRAVEKKTEEAYFFKMSKYVDRLVKYYDEHENFIEPVSRKNEIVNNFIKPGLQDLCVSRTSFTWGVQVKEDPRHVVYVWLDALTNYINALGYNSNDTALFDKFWHNDSEHEVLHVVGKEIIRFHMIYWPIFLMALGIDIPSKIYAHGWIVMKDGKMSKSKGNVIRPEPLIERYGLDAFRYFLVAGIPFGEDGLFTPETFIETINTSLVNDFGNLLNRTIGMISKYFGGDIPAYKGDVTPFDKAFRTYGDACINEYETHMDNFKIDEGIKAAISYISRANKYIEETQPWVLAKDETKKEELGSIMNHLVACLRQTAIMLSPVLLNAPSVLFNALDIPSELQTYDSLRNFGVISGGKVEKIAPLFPRIDASVDVEVIAELMK